MSFKSDLIHIHAGLLTAFLCVQDLRLTARVNSAVNGIPAQFELFPDRINSA
jgi:hypothetical protein